MRLAISASLLTCALLAIGGSAGASARGFPSRNADPVVIEGSKAPSLIGEKPRRVVAFKFGGSGWRQVPVQVDERAMVDYAAVRGGYQTAGRPFSHLAYTDAHTFAGPDFNPMLDSNDEIAIMAKDSGGSASGKGHPKGVASRSKVRIKLTDPLRSGVDRFVYLFRSRGKLKPSAGKHYVDYSFSLDSGNYKSTYDSSGVGDDGNGPPANPENSAVKTSYYKQHLLSRWVADNLKVKAGGASGIDILDGDKDQVGYSCGRSELTFSRGGGGFIANKSGPVRAIRSYIGANSGTYTQQDHLYYQRADVTKTYLRVHPGITVISQFLDYSPAASGMTYRNSLDPTGVIIDGIPDSTPQGQLDWEQAGGAQGTLSIVGRVDTDLPGFTPSSYYLDDSTSPSVEQCGGYADQQAWGSSGPVITSSGDNTDPTLASESDPANFLTGTRTIFYDAPGATASKAALRANQVDSALVVKAHPSK